MVGWWGGGVVGWSERWGKGRVVFFLFGRTAKRFQVNKLFIEALHEHGVLRWEERTVVFGTWCTSMAGRKWVMGGLGGRWVALTGLKYQNTPPDFE